MKHRLSQMRTMGQGDMLLHKEMVISVDGPKMAHWESIFQEVLPDYFKDRINPKEGAGHFFRRSENEENYSLSKSVDNFRKQEPCDMYIFRGRHKAFLTSKLLVNHQQEPAI